MTEARRKGHPVRVRCAHDGCPRTAYRAPKYRRIAVGWFFGHDGTVLRPGHLPDELAEFMEAKQ